MARHCSLGVCGLGEETLTRILVLIVTCVDKEGEEVWGVRAGHRDPRDPEDKELGE